MIKTYKNTWEIYLRRQYTARNKTYMPLCLIESLYNYLELSKNSKTLDVGCGENNLNLYYPNIVGLDRTAEADVYGLMSDSIFNDLPNFEYGIAVNSLHHSNIPRNIETIMSKCKTAYIALNRWPGVSSWEWDDISTWEQYGNVKYFWIAEKMITKEEIVRHLKNDHMFTSKNGNVNEVADDVYKQTVLNDAIFGTVRIILSN